MTAELPPNLADYFNLPGDGPVEIVSPEEFEEAMPPRPRTGRLQPKAAPEQPADEYEVQGEEVNEAPESMAARERILAEAWQVVTQDRNLQYGPPEDSFTTIANLWSAYLELDLIAQDVAAMMVLMKVARVRSAPFHTDSWVDIAGYAACGGGMTEQDVEEAEQ